VVGEGASADLTFFSADDPLVANQVRKGIEAPFGKKLAKQLKQANELDVPVLLLLDQVDDASRPVQPQWLPAPETIWQVVADMLRASSTNIAEVWLRKPNHEVVQLRPTPGS
jgi:hypothetical protein